jgi:3-isopropylmalate/(R)-2-methylmalate dehydratase large subunit
MDFNTKKRRRHTIMGMTMTQKILAAHAGLDHVEAGQLIMADLDVVMANDITGPMAIPVFRQMADKVYDKEKVVLVPDHFTPNKDIKSAENAKSLREFAKEQELTHYYEVGQMGIEHAILPEKGIVVAGECIIGADSHTCTYGALGAFSTGMGTTDIATGMATGQIWFKVPGAIKFVLTGKPSRYVSGKDIIIHIIGKIGVDGALYKSMEFTGDGIANLSMDDRFTMANMAIEAGAKNGIFPVDALAEAYIKEHSDKEYKIYTADEDAVYDEVVEIDLSSVRPTVAFPHLPGNAKTIDEIEAMEPIKIDQVVIGSCTNGRMEDMRRAAAILKGHKVHPDVRVMVIPGTQKIYKECIKEGLVDIFIDAGCSFNTPSCGPCMGGHMGVLAAGEKCVSTTNRNFVGRMGHVDSLIYLASPETAAASAIAGYIANPEKAGEM